MKRVLLLTVLLLGFAVSISAQEEISLSKDEAVEFAKAHNKQLQNANLDVEVYQEKIRAAIAQGLPQVSAGIDYSTFFNYVMEIGDGMMKFKMNDQMSANGSVSMLLFSGQYWVGIQLSKMQKQMVEHQGRSTELDVVENINNAYFTVLATKRNLEIMAQNLVNMDELLRHTENMYASGYSEAVDVDQLKISVGELKNSLRKMERLVDVSVNLLKFQLGVSVESTLNLTDSLESFINTPAALELLLKPFEIEKTVEMQLVESQEAMSKESVEMQKWSFAPTLAGTYSYTYKILTTEFDMSPNHLAALQLSVPVFSGFSKSSALQQAKIQAEQAALQRSMVQDQLLLSEDQLRSDLRSAIDNYDLQKENIDVARRVLENYRNKYEYGKVSSMDLTQANTNYLTAESNYTNAILTLLQAEVSLNRLFNTLQ